MGLGFGLYSQSTDLEMETENSNLKRDSIWFGIRSSWTQFRVQVTRFVVIRKKNMTQTKLH